MEPFFKDQCLFSKDHDPRSAKNGADQNINLKNTNIAKSLYKSKDFYLFGKRTFIISIAKKTNLVTIIHQI